MDYIQKNKELVRDVLNMLDGVKHWIESKVGLKMDDYMLVPIEPNIGDLIDDKEIRNKKGYKLARSLLGYTSENGYVRIAKAMKDEYKAELPSKYMMMKECPSLDCKS